MGEGWWFQTDMGWKYAQDIRHFLLPVINPYFSILDSDGQPESQRRVVEVWIVDISAEAVRSLSYQQGWMQPYIYEWPSHKSTTLLWSKVDPTGMIHQSQFRKATKKNSVHFQFQEWSSFNSDSQGICLTGDPGMANCSLSSTEASAWQKATACGNLKASPKNTCLTKNGPDIILFW